MSLLLKVAALLLIVVGLIFFFQGINVIPGSFMTGQMKWAICGGVMLIAGIALLLITRGTPKQSS
jgi:hypothetical protein